MTRRNAVVLSRNEAVRYDQHCMRDLGIAGIALMEPTTVG